MDIGALASVGTFIVIGATAVAAIIQLRHLRQSNQLNVLLTILRMPYDPVLHDSFEFVHAELPDRLNDPDFMRLLDESPVNRKIHKELWVLDYYERLGSYLKGNLIDPALYLDSSSPENFWNMFKPVIKRMRTRGGPYIYENFEYLVFLAQQWDRQHPEGNYPSRGERLSLD
jgi:hypothetical protein